MNTYIKCNPTLLGYDFARERLNELGFDYIAFDDTCFREDLQWSRRRAMFERLIGLSATARPRLRRQAHQHVPGGRNPRRAAERGDVCPAARSSPLTIELARRIARQFDGRLRISYSAAPAAPGVRELYAAAGIWRSPRRPSSKPGGYERFSQIADLLLAGAERREDVDVDAVTELASRTASGKDYQKPIKPAKPHKIDAELPLAELLRRRAASGCPIQQDIPAYLSRVDGEKFAGRSNRRQAQRPAAHHRQPLPASLRRQVRARLLQAGARIRGHKLDAARGARFDRSWPSAPRPGQGAAAAVGTSP